MTYLLDTNICIYALKRHERVLRRLLSVRRAEVGVSAITEAELRTGAAKSASAKRTAKLIENFLLPLSVIDFQSSDTLAYAKIRAKLERAGTPIGPLDMLIAAQAVGRGLVLVTHNEREFRRVSGLRIENWTA